MLVLFDIDDTLLDHRAAARLAATALHQSLGHARPLEEFLSIWAASLNRHFARYLSGELSYQGQRRARVRETLDPTLSDEAVDAVFDGYLASYEAAWSLFQDVRPCLDRLSRHRLGVISNGQASQQRRKLARTGISDRFECILISEECGFAKPAPEIFVRACTSVGEPPMNAIFVGDQYDLDAEAARRAGLRGVWLDRQGQGTAQHVPPTIRTLDDLPTLLD